MAPLLNGAVDAAGNMQRAKRLAVPEAVGEEDVTGGQARLQHLFDKKRIALGQLIEHFKEVAAHGLLEPKNGAHHHLNLIDSQVDEGELYCRSFPVERCQEAVEQWRDLFAAIGEQQQQWARFQIAAQVEEKLKTGVVTPMQVFDGEYQGALFGLAEQEGGQGHKEAALLLFWLQGWRRRHVRQEDGEIGQNFDEFRRKKHKQWERCFTGSGDEQGTQQIEQWSKGQRTVLLKAGSLQETRPLLPYRCFGFGHQARFADAGFA